MIAHSVRGAWRGLRRAPGFAAGAALLLALGIGASAAVFGILEATLLRGLPFPGAGRLVDVTSVQAATSRVDEISGADYLDFRDQARSLSSLAAWREWGLALTGMGDPEDLPVVRVSANFFATLGVAPAFGRDFTPEDEDPGAPRVVLLSHGFWNRRLGADPGVVGRALTLDGQPYTVIGVAPVGFRFPDDDRIALWTQLRLEGEERTRRSQRMFSLLGRLAPGADIETARVELAGVAARLAQAHPATNAGWSTRVMPAARVLAGAPQGLGLVILGAGLLLFIACVNVAHLFLARGLQRQRELAVRIALGAGRRRLALELLAEALLVGLAGAAGGLLLAGWLMDLGTLFDPGLLTRWRPASVSPAVLVFGCSLGVLSAATAALVPLRNAWRTRSAAVLRAGHAGAPAERARAVLVVAEVALAFVLLSGTGLLLQSLYRLQQVRPGFDPDRLLVTTLGFAPARYAEDARERAFIGGLLERVRALPGVQGAAMVTTLPFNPSGIDHDMPVSIEGVPAPGAEPLETDFRIATPDYFRVLGVPLAAGREFGPGDAEAAPPVAVINATAARRFFGGQDPLGRRITVGRGGPAYTVVGVAGDVRHRGLETEPRPEIFLDYRQIYSYSLMTLVLRTNGAPRTLAGAVTAAVHALDPDQPVAEFTTARALLGDSLARRRYLLAVLGGFALAGLLLTAGGIYGVMATVVAQRRREIGIRVALGAAPGAVLGQVLRRGLLLAAAGAIAGLGGSLLLGTVLQGLLFGTRSTDPVALAATASVILLVAAGASLRPAHQAARVDPVVALRSD